MIERGILYVVLLTLLGTQESNAATVLTGARIIDGTGKAPLENGAIAFGGDRITAIGPANQVQIPEGAQVVNAQGKTIIPGTNQCA